jgi:shikimate kinase
VRIFITGVSDVGKSTIGRIVAERLGVMFFDLDNEIEAFFGMTIERLQSKYLTMYSYREETVKALTHLLKRPESKDCVIALPPSGLMGGFLRIVKKSSGTIIALIDKPENLLKRITFYDIDSNLIEKKLTGDEKKWYRSEIKKDITYFGKTYDRAHLKIDISGLTIEQSVVKVLETIK